MSKLPILQAALITGVAFGLNLSGGHGYIVAVCLSILVIVGLCASSNDSENEQVASQIMVCVEGFLLVITYLFSGLPQAIILATILSLCVRAATTKGSLGGTIVPLLICGFVWLNGNNASVDAEQYEDYKGRLQNNETLFNLSDGFSSYFSKLGDILTTAATPPFSPTGDALQDILIFTVGIALLSLVCQLATTFVAKYIR